MKKWTVIGLVLLLLVGGGVATWSWRSGAGPASPPEGERPTGKNPTLPRVVPTGTTLSAVPDDHLARADKIRRDYDDMTAKFSADYSSAGNAFPGGVSAYLRQLALLQREKHKDLAAILTPRELEDLEMRDTSAGQMVAQQLGDTTATEEQRRAVFRLQKEFEDQYALVFDLSPPALLQRETDRQALQQKIRGPLGDELFGSWLRGEGPDYAGSVAFVQQAGLASGIALDLWQVKNDFILGRLQLKARTDLMPPQLAEAERALNVQTLTRVTGLIGAAAVAGPAREVLSWLPLPQVK